ncbi:MAG: hypothetical protein V1670_04990 [Candidatus Omnitrophota bacterium]
MIKKTQDRRQKTEDRSQKTEVRSQRAEGKFLGFFVLCFLLSVFCLLISDFCFAQEVTIIYSGQTHAMLYPCSCPVQQDGGIARRGSLIKKLRKIDPQLLLLDCGNFTAGGVLDEYAQNAQLDMQRSEVNFKAMRLMRYDAVGIGVGEFNFGKDFFLKNARNSNPTYLSANLETDKVLPYLIKNTGGVKIGIIGLTGLSVNAKSEGLKASAPGKVAQIVKSLKDKGVGVVILLSTLGEQEDLKLISKIKGIDILFVGENPLKTDSLTKVDTTFVLRPFWQGRKLGKLNLDIKDGKLLDCKIEELLLADTLADDAQVAAILPRCYSKADCKKEGFVVNCQNPGELKAECVFTKANKVNLRVITLEDCSICNDKRVVNLLKNKFPGIVAEYFYYPNEEAKELIKDFSIQGLPAYIFGNEVQGEDNFSGMRKNLLPINDFFMLKPQFSGFAYFLNRKEIKGSFDLFLSLFEKNAEQLLAVIREFKPALHFLAAQKDQGFEAKSGPPEVEEYLRGVCLQNYYPQKFWDYLICRAKNINNVNWPDCLERVNLAKIKSCAKSAMGAGLLKENISLNEQLQVSSGPSYLLDNQKIFSSRGVPDKDELKKVLKR